MMGKTVRKKKMSRNETGLFDKGQQMGDDVQEDDDEDVEEG